MVHDIEPATGTFPSEPPSVAPSDCTRLKICLWCTLGDTGSTTRTQSWYCSVRSNLINGQIAERISLGIGLVCRAIFSRSTWKVVNGFATIPLPSTFEIALIFLRPWCLQRLFTRLSVLTRRMTIPFLSVSLNLVCLFLYAPIISFHVPPRKLLWPRAYFVCMPSLLSRVLLRFRRLLLGGLSMPSLVMIHSRQLSQLHGRAMTILRIMRYIYTLHNPTARHRLFPTQLPNRPRSGELPLPHLKKVIDFVLMHE